MVLHRAIGDTAVAPRGGRRPLPELSVRRLGRRLTRALATAAGTVVFAACVALVALTMAGYRSAPMLSGSMQHTLPVGSLVIVKPVSATTVHVGDVVMFRVPGYDGDYTHRIHAITGTRNQRVFITKGDENKRVDPWRLRSIDGRGHFGKLVAEVPYAGYLVEYSRDWRVRLAALTLALLAASVTALRRIWKREAPDA